MSTTGPASRARGGLLAGHEPGLDGVRAVSIALVLAYHGDAGWARGGFLGISVFFALSGFLVATVLLRAHRDGGIRPTAFWARRVRRLFPAAMAALVVVGAFAATAATREQVDALPGQAVAAAANVANWKFVADGTSYADRFEAPSPVLHYWSLSIEEQFYLLAPLGLAALLGSPRLRARRVPVVAATAALAVGWGAWLHHAGASLERLYYGTDVRAGELLLGVTGAVVLDRLGPAWVRVHRRALGVAGAAAIAGIVALAATTTLADDVLWQGGLALCAALTVVVVAGVLGGWGPMALLGRGPLPALGRISYGVYLYHFPVFLWLAPGRAGLEGAGLAAARVAATLALATVSYHLLEMPVRQGWSPPLPRRWVPAAIPAAAVAVLALLGAGVARSDAEATVALGDGPGADALPPEAPPGPGGPDGVLDVLAIGDRLGADVLADVSAALAPDRQVRLVTGPDAACGGAVEGPGGTVCRSWLETWAPAVEAARPDLVVLHLANWSPAEIATDLGDVTGDEVQAVLDAGMDLLVARGATVWWTPPGRNDLGLVLEREPFFPAMRQLLVARPDLRVLDGMPPLEHDREAYVRQAAAHLAARLAEEARRPGGGARLLLVGDSQVASIGTGLQRWGEASGEALVWSVALPGCPLLADGDRRVPGGAIAPLEPECRPGQAAWPGAVAAFDPDLIVVMASLDDLADRRLPGTERFVSPGDAGFDDAALADFTAIVDRLAGTEVPVAWLTAPCVRAVPVFPGADVRIADDVERPAALNRVAERLRAARPEVVTLVDVAGRLCPDGEFLESVEGIEPVRPDGVHLSPAAADWLAAQIGPLLVAAADRD